MAMALAAAISASMDDCSDADQCSAWKLDMNRAAAMIELLLRIMICGIGNNYREQLRNPCTYHHKFAGPILTMPPENLVGARSAQTRNLRYACAWRHRIFNYPSLLLYGAPATAKLTTPNDDL